MPRCEDVSCPKCGARVCWAEDEINRLHAALVAVMAEYRECVISEWSVDMERHPEGAYLLGRKALDEV